MALHVYMLIFFYVVLLKKLADKMFPTIQQVLIIMFNKYKLHKRNYAFIKFWFWHCAFFSVKSNHILFIFHFWHQENCVIKKCHTNLMNATSSKTDTSIDNYVKLMSFMHFIQKKREVSSFMRNHIRKEKNINVFR